MASAVAVDTNGNRTEQQSTFGFSTPEGWSGPGTIVPRATIDSPVESEQSAEWFASPEPPLTRPGIVQPRLSTQRSNGLYSFPSFTTAIVDGELGVWDTSLLENDEYVLQLEVIASDGTTNVTQRTVGLTGNLKLGNFRLAFTDMVLPLAGIPVEIVRTYDTLVADRRGELGYGWNLEYRDTRLSLGVEPSGLEDIGVYTPFRIGTKVYVNVRVKAGRDSRSHPRFVFCRDLGRRTGFGNASICC